MDNRLILLCEYYDYKSKKDGLQKTGYGLTLYNDNATNRFNVIESVRVPEKTAEALGLTDPKNREALKLKRVNIEGTISGLGTQYPSFVVSNLTLVTTK